MKRRPTNQVKIGTLLMGSDHPVRLQSMLNTNTMDTDACVRQAIRIINAGGELVRITAPGPREAANLANIRAELNRLGYTVPLSADIHFNPDAAIEAARHVEKVRVNPGNFVDRRSAPPLPYTDQQYADALRLLRQRFTEFLRVCRQHGTAVRVGTNHGSLSTRVTARHGDTPEGMVEATMEYLRVCREQHFDDVVISLKSSDCRVMVQAVRLLVRRMDLEDMHYPLHLGVTEAGEGEDGRVRSAVGIGTLLNEGIGDTIRVSLTEAPEREIPVARHLLACCEPHYRPHAPNLPPRCSRPDLVADLTGTDRLDERVTAALDFHPAPDDDPSRGPLLLPGPLSPDIIYTEALGPELTKLPPTVTLVVPLPLLDVAHVYNRRAIPLLTATEYLHHDGPLPVDHLLVELRSLADCTPDLLTRLATDASRVTLVLHPERPRYIDYRLLLEHLHAAGIATPVILRASVPPAPLPGTPLHVPPLPYPTPDDLLAASPDHIPLLLASQLGGLFLDRLASGLWLTLLPPRPATTTAPASRPGNPSPLLPLARDILQSAGARRYKTEFISCPGCGRTLYDLQASVARVKQAFAHLGPLKIAVMGCIVNGPGEMGDADYGYVGAGAGRVNLYRAGRLARPDVPEAEAIEALRQLITDDGLWRDNNSPRPATETNK